MSTFTQWNSPNAGAAANIPVQKFTELIAAYSEVVNKIDRHIKSVTNEDDHHVIDYVKGELEKFEHLLDSKFATPANIAEAINNLYKANGEMKRQVEQWATNALSEPLAARVDRQTLEQELNKYQTVTSASSMQNTINSLVEISEALEGFMNLYKKKFSVDDSDSKNIIHKFEDTLEAEKLLVDTLRVHKYLDFTKWGTVALQYAGTGANDTETAGMYIVGRVSDDWKDDPQEISDAKSCRVYLKYVNSHPFDAIVDITVTKTADGYNGNIQAMVSKGDNFWENLRFHLVEVTDTQHGIGVYLGISTSSLANTVSNFNSLTIRVAGVNFIPLNRTNRVETIVTSICYTTKMPVEKKAAVLTTTIAMDALAIDNVVDSNGNSLIKVLRNIDDEDDLTKKYDVLQLGSDAFKFLQLLNRPIIFESPTDEQGNVIKDKNGNPIIEKHTLITDKDANRFSTPVGSIMFWSDFEEVTNGTDDEGNPNVIMRRAINVPKGWAALDGSILLTEGHEDFAALVEGHEDFARKYPFTDEGKTSIQLPVVDFAIIKVTACKFETVYPEYSELIDLQNVINRVNNLAKDIKAKAAKFQEHDDRHDAQLAGTENSGLKTLIEEETATAREQERGITTALQKEVRDREDSIEQEVLERNSAIRDAINNEVEQRNAAIATKIDEEANARNAAITTAINTEVNQRNAAIASAVDVEKSRAEGEERKLATAIDEEAGRAKNKEETLSNALEQEVEQRNAAIASAVDIEKSRAEAAESLLDTAVATEKGRAERTETSLGTSITAVQGSVNTEAALARSKEAEIKTLLNLEADRATTEERRLNSAMLEKEAALNTAIQTETSRAQITERAIETSLANSKAELQSNIDTANSTRNEADVNLLKYIQETYLENKQVYRDRIELPNVTPDAKGNVWHTGDIAVLFDGTNIKTVTATVNGEIVTWSE